MQDNSFAIFPKKYTFWKNSLLNNRIKTSLTKNLTMDRKYIKITKKGVGSDEKNK